MAFDKDQKRVIFLDIDGPLIPSGMFLVDRRASWERKFSPISLACVRELCKRTNAKIVFNTTHNLPIDGVDDIDVAVIKAGMPEVYLHPDRMTKYPSIERGPAVLEWLHRHHDVDDWVAFDDVRFTDAENLIWVDFDQGVHVGHINQALERWGGRQIIIL